MLPNQKLPYELLLLIFSYFPLPDHLVSVQRVCSGWRAAALDKSLWKKFTITLHGTPEDERQIKTMPGLRNINGKAKNELVNLILENVIELAEMNIGFEPPLSALQIKSIIEKYPELESITLDVRMPDTLDSVNILKTSQHLTEVEFSTYYSSIHNLTCPQLSEILKIFTVFLDVANFTALTKIHNPGYFASTSVKDPSFLNLVSEIIKKRSQQLSSLGIIVHEAGSKNMFDAINMCTNLHHLDVSLYGRYDQPFNINFDRMTRLTSLHINTLRCSSFLPQFHDTLLKRSYVHLTIIELRISKEMHHNNLEILKAIIRNMKQLTELLYIEGNRNTVEEELKEIGSLSQLKVLTVAGLTSFSSEGIRYLSQCKNLVKFVLLVRSSTVTNQQIASMIIPMKNLENMYSDIDENLGFYCRREIDEFITRATAQAE